MNLLHLRGPIWCPVPQICVNLTGDWQIATRPMSIDIEYATGHYAIRSLAARPSHQRAGLSELLALICYTDIQLIACLKRLV